MLKIGLTGGVASGKTAVSNHFYRLGVPIIDADLLSREIVRIGAPTLSALIHQFGAEILATDGNLDRPKLRRLMLQNPRTKQILEAIMHPVIRSLLTQRSHAISAPYCLIVIPLLFESGWQENVDRILTVETTPQRQLSRLQQRDNVDVISAKALIKSQLSAADRKKNADDILLNDQELTTLYQQVDTLHSQYLRAAFAMTNELAHTT